MANTFKNVTASVSTSEVTVYTATGVTGIVIGLQLANKLGSMVTVDIEAAGKILGADLPIPAGSALAPIAGKLVLENGDALKVTASDTDSVDVLLSLMEIS